jgi:DoxX-like family
MAYAERLHGSPPRRADHPGIRRFAWDREFNLWFVQIILSLFFGLAGGLKAFLPPAALSAMGFGDASQIPYWLLRFTGRAELMGALMIVMPPLCRVLASIAPVAAANFASLQLLAIGIQAFRGEFAVAWALNLVLFALSIFVLWGRIIQALGQSAPHKRFRQRPARDFAGPSGLSY